MVLCLRLRKHRRVVRIPRAFPGRQCIIIIIIDDRCNRMDIVYINELRVDTVIGVFDWERRIRQTISIDLEMGFDIRKAAASDNIRDTLDYKAVGKRIIAHVQQSEALLVERLAEEIAALVRTEFPVPWLRLRIGKPGALRGAKDVGLVIERGVRA